MAGAECQAPVHVNVRPALSTARQNPLGAQLRPVTGWVVPACGSNVPAEVQASVPAARAVSADGPAAATKQAETSAQTNIATALRGPLPRHATRVPPSPIAPGHTPRRRPIHLPALARLPNPRRRASLYRPSARWRNGSYGTATSPATSRWLYQATCDRPARVSSLSVRFCRSGTKECH
jgi:hypothetical protein